MIPRLLHVAQAYISLASDLLHRHPRRIATATAAILLCGTGATFAVANLAPQMPNIPAHTVVETVTPLSATRQIEALDVQAMRLYRSDVTRSTDTAEVLLRRLGVFDTAAAAFLRSDPQTQQTLLGRVGRNVTVEARGDNTLQKLTARWSPDDDGMFKRLTVDYTPKGFVSRLETLPMTASSRLASGSINSSLFAATDEARIPDAVAIQMADIFSGDIDFHRALRKGDRFSVVYETLEGDGEPLSAGRVLSAEFDNAGKVHQAMWFQEPLKGTSGVAGATAGDEGSLAATHSLTKGSYYTLAGESLHRTYLTSPMEFSRITSGFAMRFHPILKLWKWHTGVDYGAAIGTPVRCLGDGVVEFAGVQNGYGNVIIVRHNSSDTTLYGHLSRIDVQRGQRVTQGQHIGAVGMTGWATGPHLHFEFRVNGVFKDPLTIAKQSTTTPITAAARPAFDRAAAQVRAQLTAAALTPSTSVQ